MKSPRKDESIRYMLLRNSDLKPWGPLGEELFSNREDAKIFNMGLKCTRPKESYKVYKVGIRILG